MTDIDEALHPVLPRELTSVSGDVRVVPGPPAPSVYEPYGLRIADPVADAEMVSHWMNLPHLVAAWEYPWPPQRWQRYMQAQLEGEYSRPFIGGFRGVMSPNIEIYRAAKDSIATRYDADPYDLGCTWPSPTSRCLTAGWCRYCSRRWWPVSSRSNPVVGE